MKPPSPPSALRDAIAVGAPRASPSPTPSKKSDRCSLTAILGTFDFSFQRRSSRIPPHPEAPAIGPISSFRRSTFTPGGVSVSIAKCSILFILLVLGRPAFSALGASQGESAVGITPDAISCWPYDDFVVIQADIGPPAEVGTARVYFRATDFVDFYYVEMARNQEGLFEAVGIPGSTPAGAGGGAATGAAAGGAAGAAAGGLSTAAIVGIGAGAAAAAAVGVKAATGGDDGAEADNDGDGFTVSAGDCDDNDPSINPNGAVTFTNGRFQPDTTVCPTGVPGPGGLS